MRHYLQSLTITKNINQVKCTNAIINNVILAPPYNPEPYNPEAPGISPMKRSLVSYFPSQLRPRAPQPPTQNVSPPSVVERMPNIVTGPSQAPVVPTEGKTTINCLNIRSY